MSASNFGDGITWLLSVPEPYLSTINSGSSTVKGLLTEDEGDYRCREKELPSDEEGCRPEEEEETA